jgi:hypothetical protein
MVTLTKKGKRLEERAASVPDCMSQNWHGDAIGIDKVTNMVNTVDTLIDGMK